LGAGGTLTATLDKRASEGTLYNVAGAASFAGGATLSLALSDLADEEGRYTILQAGSTTGLSGVTTKTDLIPSCSRRALPQCRGDHDARGCRPQKRAGARLNR